MDWDKKRNSTPSGTNGSQDTNGGRWEEESGALRDSNGNGRDDVHPPVPTPYVHVQVPPDVGGAELRDLIDKCRAEVGEYEQRIQGEKQRVEDTILMMREHDAEFLEYQELLAKQEIEALNVYQSIMIQTPELKRMYQEREEMQRDLRKHYGLLEDVTQNFEIEQERMQKIQDRNLQLLAEAMARKAKKQEDINETTAILSDEKKALSKRVADFMTERDNLREQIHAIRSTKRPNIDDRDFLLERDKIKDKIMFTKSDYFLLDQELNRKKEALKAEDASGKMLDAEVKLKRGNSQPTCA